MRGRGGVLIRLGALIRHYGGGMALIRERALIRENTVYFDRVSRARKCTALLVSLLNPGISRRWPKKTVS